MIFIAAFLISTLIVQSSQASEPTLTLQVNTLSGDVSITNASVTTFEIDYYAITSPGGALDKVGWNSLSDQGIDAIGNGPGESWDEAGGSGNTVLVEAFLLGTSQVAPTGSLDLGQAFNTSIFGNGINGDLVFEFGLSSNQIEGIVEYVTVPEPTTCALALAALCLGMSRRRVS
jgi:hypothetical protein